MAVGLAGEGSRISRRMMMTESVSEKTKLLRVTDPHFVAGAVWEKRHDGEQWVCSGETAPILRWMRGKPAVDVAPYMLRRGWKWEWVDKTWHGHNRRGGAGNG